MAQRVASIPSKPGQFLGIAREVMAVRSVKVMHSITRDLSTPDHVKKVVNRYRCVPQRPVANRIGPQKRDTTMRSITTTAPATGTLILERLPQVKARTGLSRSEIYRRIIAGDFPAQIRLGERASAWDSREIDHWITGRIAARDAKAAA